MKIRSLLYGMGLTCLLCAADPFAEPNASLPDGLPIGPTTPESDNKDLPSAFSGQEAGYEKEQGAPDIQQNGNMQLQPLNIQNSGFSLTCRDGDSNLMTKTSVSTTEVDKSWQVYVNPDTNQGGTLVTPIRRGMNPLLPKKAPVPPGAPDPNLPSNETTTASNGQTFRFAMDLKTMPAVYSNTVKVQGSVWCGPAPDPMETIQKSISFDLDRTTGKLLNPNMVSLPDGWTIQWSQP
ncbi:hypothetical protein FAI40_01510 [Acetobacteraceae bacterium]|nr:hypothetical protein FAI40_01510 [Acetobacteraceae bacterium]